MQVKYQRLNANTYIVATILFSGHPYIGRHYRATLILNITISLCIVAASQLECSRVEELSAW